MRPAPRLSGLLARLLIASYGEKRGVQSAPPFLHTLPALPQCLARCLHCPSAWRAVCTAPVSALRQRPLLCPQCRCIVVQHGAVCGVVCRAHGEGEAPSGSARIGVSWGVWRTHPHAGGIEREFARGGAAALPAVCAAGAMPALPALPGDAAAATAATWGGVGDGGR
jgi:hypothetical protein